jgi:KaiC/GvpD/RAD55 family RecA-like ATPase
MSLTTRSPRQSNQKQGRRKSMDMDKATKRGFDKVGQAVTKALPVPVTDPRLVAINKMLDEAIEKALKAKSN